VEGDAGCNAIAVDDLGDVASGDGGPLDCFEDQEAVRGTLGMADWNKLPVQGSGDRRGDHSAQENRHRAAAAGESWHESLSCLSGSGADIAKSAGCHPPSSG
jgi:hypothetical protein